MSQEKDSESRIALFLIFALIAAVVIGVLWFGASTVLKRNAAVQQGGVVAVAPDAPTPISLPGQISAPFVTTLGPVASFYFAPGDVALPADDDTERELASFIDRLKAGASALIVPFNGAQAGTAADDALAQSRGNAVRDWLVRLGVPAAQLTVGAPQSDPVATDAQQAQRVELVLTEAVPTPVPAAAEPAAAESASVQPEAVEPAASAEAEASAAEPAADSAVVTETAAVATTAEVTEASDSPRVLVEDGIVKFYFGVGSAELAGGASDALLDVITAVASGRRAVISGFTDPTGDAAVNEQLAQDRAFAVRDTLIALGVPEDRIELERPVSYTGTGDYGEARRVEVRLED